jgi:hypothetical protein
MAKQNLWTKEQTQNSSSIDRLEIKVIRHLKG